MQGDKEVKDEQKGGFRASMFIFGEHRLQWLFSMF